MRFSRRTPAASSRDAKLEQRKRRSYFLSALPARYDALGFEWANPGRDIDGLVAQRYFAAMLNNKQGGVPSTGSEALPLNIRELRLEDLSEVYALGHELFTADEFPNLHRTWDEYELVDMFASDGEFCLVAEDGRDGRLLGFVLGTIIDKRRSAWTYGYLVWMAVRREFEGKGVARRLTERLTELFLEAGARIMLVDTDASNERAIRFFESEGFGHPTEHLYLRKNLTGLPEYKKRHGDGETGPGGRRSRRVGQVLPPDPSKGRTK